MGHPLIRKVTVREFNDANRGRGLQVRDKDRDGFVTHQDTFLTSEDYKGPRQKAAILFRMCADRAPAPTKFQVSRDASRRLKGAGIVVEATTKPNGGPAYEALVIPDKTAIYSFGRYEVALGACAYNQGAVRVTEGRNSWTVRLTFVDAQGEGAAELDLKDFSIKELPRTEKKDK